MKWDVPEMMVKPVNQGKPRVDFTDRYSTGVVSFDSVLKGGIPVGSLVLMLTDEGAGAQEFAFTSAAKLSLVRDKPDMKKFAFGDFYSQMQFPKQVTYVSISRARTDIQLEIDASFDPDLAEAFKRHVRFMDFSPSFFHGSGVPAHWLQLADSMEEEYEGDDDEDDVRYYDPSGTLLIDVVEESAKDGIVYIDSLTDMVINHKLDNQDMMMVLKGMRRVLHGWRGVIFFILHKGVLPPLEETRFKDCFDAVMNFEWIVSPTSSKRQRYLYFEKFGGVLPILNREDIVRFSTEISYSSGFVVVNAERIM